MRARWVVLWSIGIFCGAVLLRPVLRMVPLLRMLERSELVHVAAHLFLYGGLTALARWSGMSTARAGALALAVGVAQEGLQIAMARRGFGSPEVFDLFVDAIGIGAVLLLWPAPKTTDVTA
jgi:hypothetical protein